MFRVFHRIKHSTPELLNKIGIILFIFFGSVHKLPDKLVFSDSESTIFYLFQLFSVILLTVLAGIVFGFIMFKIGRWLQGESRHSENFVLLGISTIPVSIALFGTKLFLLIADEQHEQLVNLLKAIHFLGVLAAFFLCVMGLKKLNKYTLNSAIINIIPVVTLIIIIQFL